MKKFPFITQQIALNLLRISTSLFLAAHGFIRLYAGTVSGFGDFLNSKGFLVGTGIAWGLTFFEILGGLLMAIGFFRKVISAVFILQLIFGIVLVHAQNGWFVVGYQSGGMEYSVLLILSLIVIAASGTNKSSVNKDL
ncbi:MAG: DoxX family protein [Flavobacteriaceae bacterium CG17_big_fil_post_rev_8_21_14_2_50_33_15]|nr:MAG: DoxX family protein [Flavobacteriaceae bacterium CG17_big_fil_post_rev_8_21_14_2_50_33_15]PJB19092.1 MAG: DoxX family protein [Flavobacteriaceae bacterium CG_4_9_14_3_um_filter_33_16]